MIEPYKNKAINRLKKAKGQIDGIMKMVEESKYCTDIITQILALNGALKGLSVLVLESHLNTCGTNLASKDERKRKKFIEELLKVSDLSGR